MAEGRGNSEEAACVLTLQVQISLLGKRGGQLTKQEEQRRGGASSAGGLGFLSK